MLALFTCKCRISGTRRNWRRKQNRRRPSRPAWRRSSFERRPCSRTSSFRVSSNSSSVSLPSNRNWVAETRGKGLPKDWDLPQKSRLVRKRGEVRDVTSPFPALGRPQHCTPVIPHHYKPWEEGAYHTMHYSNIMWSLNVWRGFTLYQMKLPGENTLLDTCICMSLPLIFSVMFECVHKIPLGHRQEEGLPWCTHTFVRSCRSKEPVALIAVNSSGKDLFWFKMSIFLS